VSLLDLFNMFNLPTRERFSAIINELGVGTSGRGQDFNDILRRANPALALARQAISILDRQRSQLATIVDATGTIATEGANHTANVQRFLDSAAALSTLTASHSSALARSINLLPALLAAAQPSLTELDTVAKQGTPLVQQLHAAVPSLNRVSSDLGPFTAAAKPALAKLSTTLKQATGAIRDTTPLTKTLRSYASRSLPGTQLFAKLSSNLQRHGFVENFLSVTYYIGASLARFDGNSHMLSLLLVGPQNGLCGSYATTPAKGCSAHYGSQPAYKPVAQARPDAGASPRASLCSPAPRLCARGKPRRRRGLQHASAGQSTNGSTAPQSSAQAGPGTTAGKPAPPAQNPVQQTANTLQSLVQYLLK
jgi:phospholipid/cholesterol/gamma-HCH transport system substrate-binding protein